MISNGGQLSFFTPREEGHVAGHAMRKLSECNAMQCANFQNVDIVMTVHVETCLCNWHFLAQTCPSATEFLAKKGESIIFSVDSEQLEMSLFISSLHHRLLRARPASVRGWRWAHRRPVLRWLSLSVPGEKGKAGRGWMNDAASRRRCRRTARTGC